MAEFRKLSDVEHGSIEYDGSTTILIQNGGVIQQIPHGELFTNIREELDVLSDACAVVVDRSVNEPRLIPTTVFGSGGGGSTYDAIIEFTEAFFDEGQIFGYFSFGTFEDLTNKFVSHEPLRIGVRHLTGEDRARFLLPVCIETSGYDTLQEVRILVLDGERTLNFMETRYILIRISGDGNISAEVATQLA